MRHSPSSARYERAFYVLFLLYAAVQAVSLYRTLHYFPIGFKTEGFYSPLAAHVAGLGWDGVVALIKGTVPTIGGFGPTFRPPLTPLVFAAAYSLFEPRELYALLVNNVLTSLTVLLVYLIGRGVNARVGFFAALLFVLDPIFLAQANRAESDTMFMFFIVLFLYLACRFLAHDRRPHYGLVAASSLALILAVFTRNAGLYVWFAAALAFVVVLWRRLGRAELAKVLTVFLVVQFVPIGAWMARNYAITGNADFAGGSTGVYLGWFFVPHVIAMRDGIQSSVAQRRLIEDLNKDPAYADQPLAVQEKYLVSLAVRTVLDNPGTTLLVIADNVPKLFLSYPFEVLSVFLDESSFRKWQEFDAVQFRKTYDRSNWDLASKLEVVRFYFDNGFLLPILYGFASKIMYGLTLVGGVVGLFAMMRWGGRYGWSIAILFLLVGGVLTAVSTPVAAARFRLPVTPMLYVSTAFLADWILARLAARRRGLGSLRAP